MKAKKALYILFVMILMFFLGIIFMVGGCLSICDSEIYAQNTHEPFLYVFSLGYLAVLVGISILFGGLLGSYWWKVVYGDTKPKKKK